MYFLRTNAPGIYQSAARTHGNCHWHERASHRQQQPALRGPRVCVREVPHAGTHKLHVDVGRISVSNFLDRPHPVDVPPDLHNSVALGGSCERLGGLGCSRTFCKARSRRCPVCERLTTGTGTWTNALS